MITKITKAQLFFVLILFLGPALSVAQEPVFEDCGEPYDSKGGGGGPFDYNDPRRTFEISRVVNTHFTPYIEDILLYGVTNKIPRKREERNSGLSLTAGNISYTLRAIPNHPRALYAVSVWQLRLKEKSPEEYKNFVQVSKKIRSTECWFVRAKMFRPEDHMVHMVYGMYQLKLDKPDAALESYKQAVRLAPESPEAHYNIGLLYLDFQDFERARQHASRAYALGHPLPGLRDELISLGQWSSVEDVAEAAGS